MSRMSRRQFVSAVSAAAAGLAVGRFAEGESAAPATTLATRPSKRPNILLIMSDEHDPAVMGCYGNHLVRTPNLDRLAQQGIAFDAMYTTSPLCVPARLSFTSGKYISHVSGWNNGCRLPSDDYPSVAHSLNQAGYRSYLAGKMHYDAMHRYGFTELYRNPQNLWHHKGLGSRRSASDTKPNVKAWQDRARDIHPGDDAGVIPHDKKVTAACCEFFKNHKHDDQPFFLLAGYMAPHFPLIAPEKLYEHYKGKVPMPNIPAGHLDSLPTNYKQLRYGFGTTEATPKQIQDGRDLYYALTEWFDNQVGQVLTALQEAGLADNTIVIYTADHGENHGDHGMWWKNCMYEEAARVPLIVRWPGRWKGGQHRPGACSMVDLSRTIVDMGGGRAPSDWDGDSLLPYMNNARFRWKDMALSEYYAHNIASGFVMLRQGSWKYVYHTRMDETHGPERELYNLRDDPGEFDNLAGKPQHQERSEAMHAAMLKELGEDPEATELRCRAEHSKPYALPAVPSTQTQPASA